MKTFIATLTLTLALLAPVAGQTSEPVWDKERGLNLRIEQPLWRDIKKPIEGAANKDITIVVACVNWCHEHFSGVQASNCAALCHVLWY